VWPAFPNWRRHTRLDQTAYQRLLTAGRVIVFFTEYEGFGMPPVEAVLLGTCPVYSRLPVTTEVMAGLGQPFDNEDYGSFRQALEQALETPPIQLTAWAEALRTRFSWPAVAERVVQGMLAAMSTDQVRGVQ
jgi:glycosyltransferase involved in cell wall biosynthesis